jgi:hypothetical protein
MKHFYVLLSFFFLISWQSFQSDKETANPSDYLSNIKMELKKEALFLLKKLFLNQLLQLLLISFITKNMKHCQ